MSEVLLVANSGPLIALAVALLQTGNFPVSPLVERTLAAIGEQLALWPVAYGLLPPH